MEGGRGGGGGAKYIWSFIITIRLRNLSTLKKVNKQILKQNYGTQGGGGGGGGGGRAEAYSTGNHEQTEGS